MTTTTTDRSHLAGMRRVDVPDVDLHQAFQLATAETPYTTTDVGAVLRMTEEEVLAVLRQGPVATPVPCPSWCTQPAGHGYDSLATSQGEPARNHTADFTPHGQGRFGVELDCSEVLLDGELLRDDVTIYVAEPGRNITPAEARAMATALTAVAARLEELRSQPADS